MHRWVRTNKLISVVFGVVIFGVITSLIVRSSSQPLRYETRAASHKAEISFQPADSTLAAAQEFQLWITPDAATAFIRVEIQFDPASLKMTKAMAPSMLFNRVVAQTTVTQANTTGKIVYAVGLDPTKRTQAPASAYHFASVFLAPRTTTRSTGSIQLPVSGVQVVGSDATEFSVTTKGAIVAVNPSGVTPTSTPTPVVTPTPTRVTTPTSTLAVTLTPTVSSTDAGQKGGVVVPPTAENPNCVKQDGTWEYGPWSDCTAACGTGIQVRTATCAGAVCGGICQGSSLYKQECNVAPCGSDIIVYAAGSSANGIYPEMALLVDDKEVTRWSDIRGSTSLRTYNQYVYHANTRLSIGQIKVKFLNDGRFWWQDRNLRIDKIVLDGTTYQTEAKTTYSTGSWSMWQGCKAAGYSATEILYCDGYFRFSP